MTILVNCFIRMKRIYTRTKVDTEDLGEDQKTMIQDILHLLKDNSRTELRGV